MGDFFKGNTASAIRSAGMLVILVPLVVLLKQWRPLNWKKNKPYILAMVGAALFLWGPLYYAILKAGIGITLTINYASIIIGMFFFGWLVFKEKFTRDKQISAVLGLVGLGLVFAPNLHSIGALALLAAIVSGLATSVNMIMTKKLPFKPLQTTVILALTTAIANIIMIIILGEKVAASGWHIEWFYLLLFALANLMASWLFIAGLKHIDAGAAGVLGLLEIVFGVLFGVLFFNERPALISVIGTAIIILAAAIPYIKDYNASRGTLD